MAAGARLDPDGFQIVASAVVFVLLSALLQRPLTSGRVWCGMVAVAFADLATRLHDRHTLDTAGIISGARDFGLFLLLPSGLVLIRMVAPGLIYPRPRQPLTIPVREQPRAIDIIDAEFEEVG